MKKTKTIQIAARVRIAPHHWLRGGEFGEVIRYERRGRNNWFIQFENSFPGGGIDGDKLWFDQSEISGLSSGDVISGTVDSERVRTNALDLARTAQPGKTIYAHSGAR